MRRDARAYLADILESCDAIDAATSGMSLEGYVGNRLVRSSVEREFTIIGEAVLALSRKSPTTFESITGARREAPRRDPDRCSIINAVGGLV
jgi:uncharacterized protein with HEPN domain